jgi:pyrrolysine biosynthesis protein PylD
MTRLRSADVSGIPLELEAYDRELLLKSGCNLLQLACRAAGLGAEDAQRATAKMRASVVPIRWGQGVIEGFCQATAAILGHLGIEASVTRNADLSGLAEAYETGADAVFLADDHDFVALNTRTHQSIHNAAATGSGFTTGLDLMIGGVAEQRVLVLGCGGVGREAAATLLRHGAKVCICDVDVGRCDDFRRSGHGPEWTNLSIESDFRNAIGRHALIVEATNASEIIDAKMISSQTCIAAPGMPLGLSREAADMISNRLLHDPLQIGVATMGMGVARQLIRNEAWRQSAGL